CRIWLRGTCHNAADPTSRCSSPVVTPTCRALGTTCAITLYSGSHSNRKPWLKRFRRHFMGTRTSRTTSFPCSAIGGDRGYSGNLIICHHNFVWLQSLHGNRARLAVCDNKVLQCRHLGTRVGWVRNRAEGDLHALRPQIDADITAPAAVE